VSFWSSALYGFLLAVILAEMGIIGWQIGWIIRQTHLFKTQQMRLEAATAVLRDDFMLAVSDPRKASIFLDKAAKFPKDVLEEFLLPYLGMTKGAFLDRVRVYYRKLGILERDIKALKSPLWHVRLIGLRHIVLAGGAEALEDVARLSEDRYIIRLLAAGIVGKHGTPEQLTKFMHTMDPSRRIMEQPVLTMLRGLPTDRLNYLMENLASFQSASMRRVLLQCYSVVSPDKTVEMLPRLSSDPAKEVRIGVCMAAGGLVLGEPQPWLIKMLEDSEWEVRAQAAKALGKYKEQSVVVALEKAIGDRSFWVRQNAAAALSAMGDMGIMSLRELAVSSKDKFATDAAVQELRRHELFVAARR
jgi:hypothetical protein